MTDSRIDTQYITQHLVLQRVEFVEQIRNYPPPIPACDVQFNYLLEQRDLLTVELSRWQKLIGEESLTENVVQFIIQSPFISDVIKQDTQNRTNKTQAESLDIQN